MSYRDQALADLHTILSEMRALKRELNKGGSLEQQQEAHSMVVTCSRKYFNLTLQASSL